MAQFDWAIALAEKLIERNGEAVTLRTFTQPAGAEPWKPGERIPTDQAGVPAVFLNFSLGQAPVRFQDGTEVRVGDKQVLIAAAAVNPGPDLGSHLIRGDGSVWEIKSVALLDPNGQRIVYELWVRQ